MKMAPKSSKIRDPRTELTGIFAGMVVLLVGAGVQSRRLQIWKHKLLQFGAVVENDFSGSVTHVFSISLEALNQQIDTRTMAKFNGKVLPFQWLEDSLSSGGKVSEDAYNLTSVSNLIDSPKPISRRKTDVMAPKWSKILDPRTEPTGIFAGMVVLLVSAGVQSRRLQIWKHKLVQFGAVVENDFSESVTHVFAISLEALNQQIDTRTMAKFNGKVLPFQWLEDSLSSGGKVSEDAYNLTSVSNLIELWGKSKSYEKNNKRTVREVSLTKDEQSRHKKIKSSPNDSNAETKDHTKDEVLFRPPDMGGDSDGSSLILNPSYSYTSTQSSPKNEGNTSSSPLPYSPPDLNKDITQIFGELVNVYRALGDDRRSFSYYKAIGVIEKVPFKIESSDQVKDLPSIGKSMKDHIQEIVSTGKLSKLEFFKTDEKVKVINLFGEVWGVGPATALKLYEKGHRTLDDLKDEDSLTNAQKTGLKYYDDIKTRIPRHEVTEMEVLLQKVGEEVLPGVVIVCGGSYRRGKASCGDMDIVITHPDGKSHKGFLSRYVKHLKEMKFLREDLVFSTHSEEGSDLGVDTYFGLCTYPGRELRHRIDLKVYPSDIYAFGLIAWTGNDVLNRRLRILADSKGYRLDDTGLFLSTQGSGQKRGTKVSKSLSLKTEKEVFDFLGFPCLEPHERNL